MTTVEGIKISSKGTDRPRRNSVPFPRVRRISRHMRKLEGHPYPVYLKHVNFVQWDGGPRLFLVLKFYNSPLFEIIFTPPITDDLISFALCLLKHYYPDPFGLSMQSMLSSGDPTLRIVSFP